jgi:hypothetical protein
VYELGENSITLSPNDMESIINSANQYARDIERIDADSSADSSVSSSIQLVSNLPGIKDLPPLSPVIIECVS